MRLFEDDNSYSDDYDEGGDAYECQYENNSDAGNEIEKEILRKTVDILTPTKKRKIVEDPDSGGAQNSNVEIEEQLDQQSWCCST